MRAWVPLVAIGTLFVVLCTLVSNATPYRTSGMLLHQKGPDGAPARVPDVGAPDERQHANYIAHVMSGKGIPVLDPTSPNLIESYQSHQPPLYYVLAAGWCKVVGADPQAAGEGSRARFLNTLIGLGTIVGLFFGGRWAFRSDGVGLAAAAMGLLPMNIGLHAAVSNDPLLILLCTWSLALFARLVAGGWTIPTALVAGVLVGLACLTKTTAVVLVPTLLLAGWLSKRREETFDWKPLLLGLGAALVLAVPWWIRNTSLYGDPLALGAFKQAFVGSPQASMFIGELGPMAYWTQWVGWWTARSAIGVFGYMDIFLLDAAGQAKSDAVYLALWVVMLIPIFGAMVKKPVEDSSAKGMRETAWVWGVFSLFIVLAFVRFNMQYFQGQARYLYPALGPFAWLFACGLVRLMGKRGLWAWVVPTVALSLLNFVFLNELSAGFARRLV